jgi:hypothetical protein
VPSITVDGGSWYGADGTGYAGEPGDGRYMPDANWGSTLISDKSITSPDNAFDGINDTSNSASVDQNGYLQFPLPEVLDGDFDVLIRAHFSNQETIDTSILNSSGNVIETVRNNNIASNEVTTVSFTDIVGAAAVKTICVATGTEGSDPGGNGDKITHLIGVKYNDQQFISSSVSGGPTPPGATTVSKTVSSDASLTFTSDLELANMVGPLSQVDENGDVKTPVTSEIASVQSGMTLSTVSCNLNDGGSGVMAAIYVDGVLLDAGQASFYGSVTAGDLYAVNQLFSPVPEQVTYSTSGYSTFTFDPPITVNNSLNIMGYKRANSASSTIYVNDVEVPGLVNDVLTTVPFPINTELTFEAPNPDLQYFQPGDNVGIPSGFSAVKYTGNGNVNTITGVGFSPSLVWIKSLSQAYSNALFDTMRGVENRLISDSTAAQDVSPNGLTAFNADGFTAGNNNSNGGAAVDYIAWCFDAGDTTVTNTNGTLESQVSSNGYFSIIRYVGAQNQTVGHGLASKPRFLICKQLSTDQSWPVWWAGMVTAGDQDYLMLDKPDGYGGSGSGNFWNNTPPTDSVFTIGDNNGTAQPSQQYVAYAWTNEPGKVSIEGYSGNGSDKTVNCGFRPALVMIKRTDSSANWVMVSDTNKYTFANANNSVMDGQDGRVEITDTGFIAQGNDVNNSGGSFMYAAFAGANPIEVVDVDVAANTMTVDNSGYEVGETVTGPPLIALADDIEYLDGNTLGVNGVSGTWLAGLHAQGAEITSSAPSPESIVFTSMNAGTTEFTGTDATLTSRIWTLEKSTAATGPWTEVGVYLDSAANDSQDGATPWDNPALEANTFYQVKVQYDSNNADSVVSTFNTFKTGDA